MKRYDVKLDLAKVMNTLPSRSCSVAEQQYLGVIHASAPEVFH